MPLVLIIGGGITGLTAAYELMRRGIRPLILEATGRAGGLILTDRAGGFTIEAGPDSVIAAKPAALELFDQLGLRDEILDVTPPGRAFVLRGDCLFPLPSPSRFGLPLTWRALAAYELLPWPARLRMALEPLVPVRRDATDESVASFFERRFGKASVDLIAQPLLGGIHAGEIDRLSMLALFPHLREQERRNRRVLAMSSPKVHGAASAGPIAFKSLRSGMDLLVSRLVERLPVDTVRMNARARGLARSAAGWRVTSDGQSFDAAAVILAAPAFVAAALLRPFDPEAAGLCAEVSYVSTASVALAWPRNAIAHPLRGTGFVVARQHSNVRITACTWVSSKWQHRAPAGFALLRAYVGGAHDPAAVDLPDESLADIVRADLARVLGITGAPLLTRVYRWRRAGAQHTVGQPDRMKELERRLAVHPGLFVAGSGFRSVGIPDCIADARRAASDAAAFIPDYPIARFT